MLQVHSGQQGSSLCPMLITLPLSGPQSRIHLKVTVEYSSISTMSLIQAVGSAGAMAVQGPTPLLVLMLVLPLPGCKHWLTRYATQELPILFCLVVSAMLIT